MTWIIRPALVDDAKRVACIDAAASAHPWSESQLTAACTCTSLPNNDSVAERVLLLVADDEIYGFVVYSLVLDESSILNIAVHPSRQGQGGARTLLQGALDGLTSGGAQRCMLEVRVSNIAARELYNSFEFQVDGVRKKYYSTESGREDALLMSKQLFHVANQRTPQ